MPLIKMSFHQSKDLVQSNMFDRPLSSQSNPLLRCRLVCVLLVLTIFISGCVKLLTPRISTGIETLRAGEYKVDPQHTVILFKIDHLGYAKFVGRFNRFDASLDFSPENMTQAKLSARVDMSSVDVNLEKLEKRLRGNAWFNVDKYPYATFETINARVIDSDTALFKGNMTFLGITSPVDVLVKFNGGGTNVLTAKYTIGFEASAKFLRSSFDLDKFIPAIGDEVELEIHAEFQRQ